MGYVLLFEQLDKDVGGQQSVLPMHTETMVQRISIMQHTNYADSRLRGLTKSTAARMTTPPALLLGLARTLRTIELHA